MEKNKNWNVVKCPHCGAEYTLDEIFIPQYITGKVATPVKNSLGKILYIDYEIDPDLVETFNCDFCKKDFNVELDVKNKSSVVDEEVDFTSDEIVTLF